MFAIRIFSNESKYLELSYGMSDHSIDDAPVFFPIIDVIHSREWFVSLVPRHRHDHARDGAGPPERLRLLDLQAGLLLPARDRPNQAGALLCQAQEPHHQGKMNEWLNEGVNACGG